MLIEAAAQTWGVRAEELTTDKGRVIQSGAPRDMYRRPATRFVADFLGKSNFIEGDVVERQHGGPRGDAGPGGDGQRFGMERGRQRKRRDGGDQFYGHPHGARL